MATLKTQLPPFDGAALGSVITVRPDINSRLLHGFLFQVVGTGSPTFAEYVEYLTLNQDDKQKCLLKPLLQAMADALKLSSRTGNWRDRLADMARRVTR